MAGGTTGGLVPFTLVSTSGANITQIVPGPCQLVAFNAGNVNAAARFVKFYDTAIAASSGLSGQTPVLNFIIPGNTAGAGSNIAIGGATPLNGYQFYNGMSLQITGTIALADQSGVLAGDVCVNIGWR